VRAPRLLVLSFATPVTAGGSPYRILLMSSLLWCVSAATLPVSELIAAPASDAAGVRPLPSDS
jgi:hypothetical protein